MSRWGRIEVWAEGLGCRPCLVQLLEATLVPWLVAPFTGKASKASGAFRPPSVTFKDFAMTLGPPGQSRTLPLSRRQLAGHLRSVRSLASRPRPLTSCSSLPHASAPAALAISASGPPRWLFPLPQRCSLGAHGSCLISSRLCPNVAASERSPWASLLRLVPSCPRRPLSPRTAFQGEVPTSLA